MIEAHKSSLITFRKVAKGDENFILVSWLHGLKFGNDYFKDYDDRKYYEKYQLFIKQLMRNAAINIACLAEDPDVVLGYAVMRGKTLDWVYVKKAWRNIGLAKSLIAGHDIEIVSHLTKAGNSIRKRKGWQFIPYEAYVVVQE